MIEYRSDLKCTCCVYDIALYQGIPKKAIEKNRLLF